MPMYRSANSVQQVRDMSFDISANRDGKELQSSGMVYGKMFGINNARLRETYTAAWTKASQVWITGIKTFEYEKMVFNEEIDPKAYGIRVPDLIGWKGGQPITLKNGTKLSVGFSGFRGITDLEIMVKALAKAEQELPY